MHGLRPELGLRIETRKAHCSQNLITVGEQPREGVRETLPWRPHVFLHLREHSQINLELRRNGLIVSEKMVNLGDCSQLKCVDVWENARVFKLPGFWQRTLKLETRFCIWPNLNTFLFLELEPVQPEAPCAASDVTTS